MSESPAVDGSTASLIQPLTAGLLAAFVGFASTFTVVLAGFSAVGATPVQAASGLMVLCLLQGGLGVALSLATRMPISIVWATPASALLIATGALPGGFPTAVGAILVAGVLIVLAGIVRPFGRLVEAIPRSLANGLLAGVLFEICLAPVTAVHQSPGLILPVVVVWLVALRFARRWAIPIAVACTGLVIALVTRLPPGAFAGAWPTLAPVAPSFRWDVTAGLAVPLFVVTMASQNIPGLAVLRANGYHPDIRTLFVTTGLASIVSALGSGAPINLAAITAALCAGPESHPDPGRRYVSTIAAGLCYVAFGLFAAVAAAFIAASPSTMIQAVAGLALMGSFGNALAGALADEDERLAVAVTFVTVASGVSFLGIGSTFWGLVAGAVLLAVERWRR